MVKKTAKKHKQPSDSLSENELQEARECLWKHYAAHMGWIDYMVSNRVALEEKKKEIIESNEIMRGLTALVFNTYRVTFPIIETPGSKKKDSDEPKKGIELKTINYLEESLKKNIRHLEDKLQYVNAG